MTVMKTIKKAVRSSFLAAGLDIRRRSPHKLTWLKKQNIKTVFDIGANTGQFAVDIHSLLPEATIYSFEPLKHCYERLMLNMRRVPQFTAFNFALGDTECEMEIHRSQFSPSSSLRPMAELHKELFPFTSKETIERVQVKRLDDIVLTLGCPGEILVKIDVQGYEEKVILGGKRFLAKAKILIVETSFQALYEGQPSFDEVYNMVKGFGFSYAGSIEQIRNPADSSILQADSIFLK